MFKNTFLINFIMILSVEFNVNADLLKAVLFGNQTAGAGGAAKNMSSQTTTGSLILIILGQLLNELIIERLKISE